MSSFNGYNGQAPNSGGSHGGNRDPNAERRQAASQPQYSQTGDFSGSSTVTYAKTGASYSPSAQQSYQPNQDYQYQDQEKFSAQAAYSEDNGHGVKGVMNVVQTTAPPDDIEAYNHLDVPRQRGYSNISEALTVSRMKWPNFFQNPGIQAAFKLVHHRDIMQRERMLPFNEYYLSPTDGHAAKMVVQTSQDIYDTHQPVPWRRTFIRNRSSWLLQAASLPFRDGIRPDDPDWGWKCGMWLPSCFAVLLLLVVPTAVTGEVRNGGFYDSFPYKDWGYPYHARNPFEAKEKSVRRLLGAGANASAPSRQASSQPLYERFVEPKSLCFLEHNGSPRELSEWKQEHGNYQGTPAYVFVSYTSRQLCGDDENSPQYDEDFRFLHQVGKHAANAAGVPAYWLATSNLGPPEEIEDTVFGLSDIIRGAHSVVIAVGNIKGESFGVEDLLKGWGDRVWTFPEVLLCQSKTINIYAKGYDTDTVISKHRKNFAAVWSDASESRELIDHFEGNLLLSPAELQTVALRCFHNRSAGSYFPGDKTYALMGLLLKRPKANRKDTPFQAFARLSLANESNQLMERLACILPQTYDQPWYDMSDQWSISLSDIYPSIQVCGIGAGGDTVIIDGAHAASIRWKAFATVACLTKDSWKRFFIRYLFRSSGYLFFLAVVLLAISSSQGSAGAGLKAAGAILLVISLLVTFASPILVRMLYTGKLWATQPWFFGFEGYMPLSTIERHVFGRNFGHLKWSVAGSPLSTHMENKYDECVGVDPTIRPDVADRVRRAVKAPFGEERIFTLVDTYTLTVTMFAAKRPPTAVVLCGYEGGMQRAMLCSYDHTTQTLFRESVIRMETPVLEKMFRVGRFKFGFNRP